MATVLTLIRADRSNRAILTFSDDLDTTVLELGTGLLNPTGWAGPLGSTIPGPAFLRFEAVAGNPDLAYALFDNRFESISYRFTFSDLVDWTGAAVAGTDTFLGMLRSAARLWPYDQRLKIDLAMAATPGGDLALLTGDDWIKEQAERMLSWELGTYLAAPTFGRPWAKDTPLRTSDLLRFKRSAERFLKQLPGVVDAGVALSVSGNVFRTTSRIKTDQSEIDVSTERIRGVA